MRYFFMILSGILLMFSLPASSIYLAVGSCAAALGAIFFTLDNINDKLNNK